VNYLNLVNSNIINWDIDWYDDNGHLNPSGARKVTAYIGEYLKNNYELEDLRNHSAYDFWYNDYDKYVETKNENFRNCTDFASYLMLLYDDSVEAVVTVNNQGVLAQEKYQNLLENAKDAVKVEYSSLMDEKTVSVVLRRNGVVVDEVEFNHMWDEDKEEVVMRAKR